MKLTEYNKNTIKEVNESNLIIHWWNFGKKTLSFSGTAKERLNKNKIIVKFSQNEYEGLNIKISGNIGHSKFSFTENNYEDAVKQVIMFNLSYMGDKAKFILNNREFSNNFHR